MSHISPSETRNGALVVFEGPDGVGKTTISQATHVELEERGVPSLLLSFPGREEGSLGRLVYDIHHDPARFGIRKLTPASQQALHIAAHLDLIEQRILPAVQSGAYVLLDRFWWSTWVYGSVAGVDHIVLEHLIDAERAAWGPLRPRTLLLVTRRQPIGRPEQDLHAWHILAEAYAVLAERERVRHPVQILSNDGSVSDSTARATNLIITSAKAVGLQDP